MDKLTYSAFNMLARSEMVLPSIIYCGVMIASLHLLWKKTGEDSNMTLTPPAAASIAMAKAMAKIEGK